MNLKYFCLSLLAIFVLYSCATYAPQYRELDTKPTYPTEKTLSQTFYLIGDAGYSPIGGMSEGLQAFQNYLDGIETAGALAIFLGDNIYPDGMPPKGAPDRSDTEYRLDAQIVAVENFKGQLYFIPGNHDWYNEGLYGLERQELYFEDKLKDRNVFQPTNGCPLKSVTISDEIQLIMIDSQWYLEDWNIHPTINENCEIKTREKFFIELELELEKNKNKTVVFAMHHPMFTNGTHGGYFGAEKHLFPTQKNIPMPGLASLVAQIRAQGGVSVQDRYNELSNKFMNKLAGIAKKHGKLVFASGHEHTLQYIEEDGLVQIQSGSGAKNGFAALGKNGLFSYGGQGFAVFDVFTDGSSYVRYYGADAAKQPKLLFEKEVFPPTKTFDLAALKKSDLKTITTPIYEEDSINEALFFNTVWGKKYKPAYAAPVTANVADLDSLYGGLSVVRANNTKDYKSLLLRDAFGNLYRMRALKKQALALVDQREIVTNENPENERVDGQQQSDFVAPDSYGSEFYTASHPYVPLILPTLADSIHLFHNKPLLVYVPKQQALKNYNEDFGDELYFISVAPSENNEGDRIFRFARDIETTDDILLKTRKAENRIGIDEQTYIKSRLFDMLIGDWDREPDHWSWALYYSKGRDSVYVPIAKNRDDAFASLEGDILDVARSILGSSNQRHIYTENLTDFSWFNAEGIILDRALLQRSTEQQWKFLAEEIQRELSDEVIEGAFNMVPPSTQGEALDEIKSLLKARRDNLVTIAENYYAYFNKLRTIEGTNGNNYFEITRLPEGETMFKVFDYVNGEKGALQREIRFDKSTKQVWVYGLDGEDFFEVHGTGDSPMLVRLIGGQDNDVFSIENGTKVRVYDHKSKPNTVTAKNGATVRFTDLYTLNTYDYRKQVSQRNDFVAVTGYNPDDGMKVGLQFTREINGFSRNPFSKQHKFNAGYYFDTASYDVAYQGEIANLYRTLNLSFGARVTSPNFILNYFGYGNETINREDEGGFDANRVEVQTISGNIGLLRNSFFGSFFKLQTRWEAISVNSMLTGRGNPGNTAQLDSTDFFGTLEGIYSYRSFDDTRNPSRGMMFDLNVGITDNLDDVTRVFGFLKTRLGFYNSISTNEKLVLKTNVQGQFNFGNKFNFYQAVQIGASNGLRGFREERFAGKSSLVGSADLRYSFNEFKIELFPLQIGVYAGADLGRVWTPSGNSKRWHNTYGGGLWMNGRGGFNASASVFHATEGTRFVFGLGFGF